MKRKKCSYCQIEKTFDKFYNKKESSDGKDWTCIECCKSKVLLHGKRKNKECLKCLKRFKSVDGLRLCNYCNNQNKNFGELYTTGNVTYRRTGARG